MSSYTISLKSIISIKAQEKGESTFADVRKLVDIGGDVLFPYDMYGILNVASDYNNITDETYMKEYLDSSIQSFFVPRFVRGFILKYLNRDICCDDIDLFLLYLEDKVRRKMPIYYSRFVLLNMKLEKELGVVSGETSTKNDNKSLSSQFPKDIVNADEFHDVKHMDSGAMGTGEGHATSKSVDNAAKISQVRELLDIKSHDLIEDFINDMSDLFLGIY